MALLGIDIGTSYCVLATIQKGALQIVRNDLSERLTPALVSFTEKERLVGESAQSQIRSNYKNTARYIKQLLGCGIRTLDDFNVEAAYSLCPLDFTDEFGGNFAGYRVVYGGEERVMSATRCMAALLTKLKDIGEKFVGSPVYDCVISVPGWYSEPSRQAMLDAAKIAGLNCLRTMNEHAAVALDYGIFRSPTFCTEKSSRVVFIGFGHGATNVSIVDYVKGELRVLAVGNDKSLGGRDVDHEIIRFIAGQFESKYRVNPLNNKRAILKLEEASTKVKKVLSANSEAPVNIECLMDDHDFQSLLSRQQFETLCEPFRNRLTALLKSTFEGANISPDSIHSIEIVGGCSRIPWVQETINKFFNSTNITVSKTLNMDETVARGCALQAAMLNPCYKVREFSIVDRLLESVTVSWLIAEELKSSILFPAGSSLSSTAALKKTVTFNRHSNFEVRLVSGPKGEPLVCLIEVPAVAGTVGEDCKGLANRNVKLRVRVSPNGIVSIDEAVLTYEEEVVESTPAPVQQPQSGTAVAGGGTGEPGERGKPDGESAGTEGKKEQEDANEAAGTAAGADSVPEAFKKKVVSRRLPCKIRTSPRTSYLSREAVQQLAKDEAIMTDEDKKQHESREMMNTLESYIYRMRNRIQQDNDNLAVYGSNDEIQRLESALNETEDWLYNDSEGTVAMYCDKLKELKSMASPMEERQSGRLSSKEALEDFSSTVAMLRSSFASPEYSHVEATKLNSLWVKITDAEKLIEKYNNVINSTAHHLHIPINAKLINQEHEMLKNFAKTVLIRKTLTPVTTADSPSNSSEQDSSTTTSNTNNNSANVKPDDVPMADVDISNASATSGPSSSAKCSPASSKSPAFSTGCAYSETSPQCCSDEINMSSV